MKARIVVIVLSVIVLVLGAFFLGQRTQMAAGRKAPAAKKAAKPRIMKKAVVPEIAAIRPSRPAMVAIVIDDFGYNTNNLKAFFDIREPLTFSILPNLRRSRDVAMAAKQRGCEVILHMPMASHRKDVKEEPDTLTPGDSIATVEARLAKAIESVPGAVGVSNHMGSSATENKALMSEVLVYLKKKSLYFFDSLTSEKSVCREAAESAGIRFARRDVFLDNYNDVDAIGAELADLGKLAMKRGRAIAICHDRKNTAIALAKAMPQMAGDGIKFVYLSDMEK
ncbi:MAG: divergent polysaccharide deacetylase family protein [Candidatus Omnitrophota bacterium]|nr:divergent polysaccharide deacetylase family protein [Candidatus Omnitrophota bacterium]